jgi:nitroreductase
MEANSELNAALDRIIENRRSVRAFRTDAIPTKEMVEAIVHAGLWAPYAAAMVQEGQEYRKFFVVQHDSPLLARIEELIRKNTKATLEQMERNYADNPALRESLKGYTSRLSRILAQGFPALLEAPVLIIAGERKAMFQTEKKSLAHVVQNMWLKTTALGLGLWLLSMIESLSENKDFTHMLGVTASEYSYAACMVGFPAEELPKGKRPADSEVTKWL